MTRYHATPEGNVPFTAEEEAEWDAMEASWMLEQMIEQRKSSSKRNAILKVLTGWQTQMSQ